MTNKRFWLGILAITLVFGMTVVGCDNDPGKDETYPDFRCKLTVRSIPVDRNGEAFTMSLLDKNNNSFVSKEGIITKSTNDYAHAEAIFIVKNIKDLPSLDIRENGSGDREYTCYVTLKIGNDTPLTSTNVIGIPMSANGTVLVSTSMHYSLLSR